MTLPSCGSTFKRPEGRFAGTLIEECGLKGCRVGGCSVSTLHAGFLVNDQQGSACDYLSLIAQVQKTVYEKPASVWNRRYASGARTSARKKYRYESEESGVHFLILTGMSGAGKTVAIRYLEDLGALCVDNLPPMMLVPFMEACQNARLHNPMIAIAADVRSGEFSTPRRLPR